MACGQCDMQQYGRVSPEQSSFPESQHNATGIASVPHLLHKKVNDERNIAENPSPPAFINQRPATLCHAPRNQGSHKIIYNFFINTFSGNEGLDAPFLKVQ